MSTAVKSGLAALREYQAEQARLREERDRPKADWMVWSNTGAKGGKKIDTVQVRFLNDWDEDSEVFEKFGAPILAVEHQAPGDRGFMRRASCTIESEGECYACERHAMRIEADKGGWRQRTNFYINGLVKFSDDVQKVVILSRNANASFVEDLLQELEDEGNISGANYRLKVTGDKTTTKWGLKRQSGEPFSLDGVEAYNLEELAVRNVPYAEQAAYYGAVYGNDEGASKAEVEKEFDASSINADW